MRLVRASVVALAAALVLPAMPAVIAQDADRVVAGGGITVPGWQGKVDARAAKQGRTIKDSKFVKEGNGFHLSIGPAAIYWDPSNTASGAYTVSGTFKEGKMAADHPHPYGVFIGGKDLDSDKPTLMYCVAYGNGTYLIRGFSAGEVVTVAKPTAHEAINKVGADGSVQNEVGWRVTADGAECVVNGKTVQALKKDELMGTGKLESTDGIYGLRVSHNVDVTVSDFAKK
jgi:hypothetical protein